MPDISEYESQEEWMKVCVPKMMDEGKDNDQAVGACMGMWANKSDAIKYKLLMTSVKAMGDWELDVVALPYIGKDSDQQWFDAQTDTMQNTFEKPAIFYHHGVTPGRGTIEDKPVIIGKALSVEKQSDGLHVRVLLDKTVEYAKRVWEAAKKGLAVASSDSIAHLARLEVGGKLVMYEKNKPGRIAVWPLAGLSLWDKVEGNFLPASRYALALPAMKAIYRKTGLRFPEIELDACGAVSKTERAEITELRKYSMKNYYNLKNRSYIK